MILERLRSRRPELVVILTTIGFAAAGGAVTFLDDWYYSLRQPAWKPPDWLFGPAWTLIFGLIAWSAVLAWRAAPARRPRARIAALFIVNGILNVMWSALFFALQRPDWALLQVVVLWLSIAAIIYFVAPFSPFAAWLLAPYLLWVSFASTINTGVVLLNGPFGGT